MNELHFRTIQCVTDIQRILGARIDGDDPVHTIRSVLESLAHSLDAKAAYIVGYDSEFTKCEVVYEWKSDGAPSFPREVCATADFYQAFFRDQPHQKALIEPLIFNGRWLASLALSLPEDSDKEHAPEVLRLLRIVGTLLSPFWENNHEAIRSKTSSAVKLTLSDEHVSESAKGIHALIVEDNVMNQIVLAKIVEMCGAVAHVAETGKDCVEICKQRRFDVIFMDLSMPLMDGFDATRLVVTSCPLNKSTPIVAVTSNVTEGIERRCEKIGMKHYISKPIEVKQVVDVMDTL